MKLSQLNESLKSTFRDPHLRARDEESVDNLHPHHKQLIDSILAVSAALGKNSAEPRGVREILVKALAAKENPYGHTICIPCRGDGIHPVKHYGNCPSCSGSGVVGRSV